MPETTYAPGTACHCLRCDHWWYTRIATRPGNCARCHSPYWDKPRQAELLLKLKEGKKC